MKQLFFFLLFAVSSFLAQAQCDEAEFKQLIAEAEKAEKADDYEIAVNKYTAAIIICPDNAEIAQARIVAVFKKIERLKTDAENAKNNANALLSKSKELTKAFLPDDKKDVKVWQYFGALADAAFALGEYEQADKNYKLAKNDPDLPPKNSIETRLNTNSDCWELQKKAILALEKQNYDQAEEHMKKILTNNPLSRKDIIIASAANPLLGLTLVQGGTFLMGTEGNNEDETLHEVTLSSFEMSRYEVTNLQYAAFLNRYGSDTVKTGEFKGQKLIYEHSWGVKKNENGLWQAQAGYEYHPVVYVTWYGANEYCNYSTTHRSPMGIRCGWWQRHKICRDAPRRVSTDRVCRHRQHLFIRRIRLVFRNLKRQRNFSGRHKKAKPFGHLRP